MAQEVTPDAIMQLGFGYWGSKTLLSAVELGLFTALAEAPLTLDEARARFGLHERGAADFLDALVALGMLRRDDGRYANTPATALYLDRAKPTYIGGMMEMMSARLFRYWADLTEGLRTGQPQNEARHGGDLFGVLYSDPVRLEQFLSAMTGLSLGIAHAIARKFPWAEARSFVDVGAAQGGLPVVLAQTHPHLAGIGADLPVVRPVFEKYVASFGLQSRLTFAPLDFFHEPLPRADVVIMGHILHDWDLPTKRMLIGKAYDALPPGGLADSLRSPDRRRAAEQRVRAVDEPQHADRNPRRLRLHRRRRRPLDAGSRLPRNPRRTPERPGLDGGGSEVISGGGRWTCYWGHASAPLRWPALSTIVMARPE